MNKLGKTYLPAGSRSTRVLLSYRPWQLSLRLTSAYLSRRQRKALLYAMVTTLRPYLNHMMSGYIFHSDARSGDEKHRCFLDLREALCLNQASQRLGFRIRMCRLALGWSQHALGRLASIHPTHLSRIEHGKCQPQRATIAGICEALGLSVAELTSAQWEERFQKAVAKSAKAQRVGRLALPARALALSVLSAGAQSGDGERDPAGQEEQPTHWRDGA